LYTNDALREKFKFIIKKKSICLKSEFGNFEYQLIFECDKLSTLNSLNIIHNNKLIEHNYTSNLGILQFFKFVVFKNLKDKKLNLFAYQ